MLNLYVRRTLGEILGYFTRDYAANMLGECHTVLLYSKSISIVPVPVLPNNVELVTNHWESHLIEDEIPPASFGDFQ